MECVYVDDGSTCFRMFSMLSVFVHCYELPLVPFFFLSYPYQAQFSSDGYNLPYGGSEMNTRAALQDLVHGVLSKVVTGKVDCKEESGVTQLCVKGKNGEDRVIEFKTVGNFKTGSNSCSIIIVQFRKMCVFFCAKSFKAL